MSHIRSHITLLALPVSIMAGCVDLVARAALECSPPLRFRTATPLPHLDGIAAPN